MRVLIRKWGHGAAVRIPEAVMAAASLSVGQAVEVREENGRVVVEPVRSLTYSLDELLKGMRPETFPDDDAGLIFGQETW